MDSILDDTDDKKSSKKEKDINFTKDIRVMLYGLGDETPHCTETVKMLDSILKDYVVDMTSAAAALHNNEKVVVADFLYLVRNDSRKHARALHLLKMNEDFKQTKRAADFQTMID
ncbi:Transcription initiation factor TFIID subunit 13 [Thelohanellus kitauei]|uniref:Transcription initiation factor TFIID subunit 13 n=1 Tax=Thelohanellus kitauei TaxID=669202 RepID=A0A0C2JYN6_THEKT|nr:Transcription initiation factor TFIID subunit 13 [Thelohanellus kitauei]